MGEVIWLWLGRIASLAGLVTLFVTFSTWLKVRLEQKAILDKIRSIPPSKGQGFGERRQKASQVETVKPVALFINLLAAGRAEKAQVEQFVKANGRKFKMPVNELRLDGVDPDELGALLQEIKNKRTELNANQYTEVHLFFAGPAAAGILVGAAFDNWIPVKVYQLTNGQYQFWCQLEK